jgi:biopolymer transport protein ExbB
MKTRIPALFAAVLISLTAAAATFTSSALAQDAQPAPAAAAPADAAAAPAAAPAPVAEAAPVSAEPVTEKQTVKNPYGFEALWIGGDFITHGTLVILFIMSMGSWYFIVTKLIDQTRLMGQAKDAKNKFWKAGSVPAGISALKVGSPFRFVAETASGSIEHHEGALLEQIDLNSWVAMSIQRAVDKIQSRLQEGLAFLATVGSTAPFVGLFGTVWGIYHALTEIGIAGQASIDKVAGPVGEALIMTAIGLFVAVPAVLGYNWLVRRNKGAMEEVRAFSADLHSVLLSGAMTTSEASRATVKKVG